MPFPLRAVNFYLLYCFHRQKDIYFKNTLFCIKNYISAHSLYHFCYRHCSDSKAFICGFLDVIHIYDTASVTGEKTFHSLQKFFEFLEGYVGAYDTCICGMYLNCIAVGIHVQDAPDRNLYRGTVRDQFYISGVL